MTEMEELMKKMKEVKDKAQDDFIDHLCEDVEWYCEKASAKGYEPTLHEQEAFAKIANIITNMKEWF